MKIHMVSTKEADEMVLHSSVISFVFLFAFWPLNDSFADF